MRGVLLIHRITLGHYTDRGWSQQVHDENRSVCFSNTGFNLSFDRVLLFCLEQTEFKLAVSHSWDAANTMRGLTSWCTPIVTAIQFLHHWTRVIKMPFVPPHFLPLKALVNYHFLRDYSLPSSFNYRMPKWMSYLKIATFALKACAFEHVVVSVARPATE